MKKRSLMLLNQVCTFHFKEPCQDIVEDIVQTRLDGGDIDLSFEPDRQFMQMNSEQLAGGDIFTLENYKILFKKKQ